MNFFSYQRIGSDITKMRFWYGIFLTKQFIFTRSHQDFPKSVGPIHVHPGSAVVWHRNEL